MMTRLGKSAATTVVAFVVSSVCAMTTVNAKEVTSEPRRLNILNWTDYIAEDTIKNFEKETGIKVRYDLFESNEVLEAKLLAGQSGYDIVSPSADFVLNQVKAGAYLKLDKSQLPNWKNLDPKLLDALKVHDANNEYSMPYLWGTTGIAYNDDMIKKYLGDDAPVDSWALVFDKKYISKLHQCGVAFLNAPTEVIPAALAYLGLDPNTKKPSDLKKAEQLLMSVREHVTYFHSARYISDIANGDICVAIGWSGDVFQAVARAEEANNGVNIKYVIPKEGAGMWFDMFGIPADAPNKEEAHVFLNYILRPDVIAEITDYVAYANPNQVATPLVDKSISSNPGIYPTAEAEKRLYVFEPPSAKMNRLVNRTFTKISSGQ